jgi:hypothetical protein
MRLLTLKTLKASCLAGVLLLSACGEKEAAPAANADKPAEKTGDKPAEKTGDKPAEPAKAAKPPATVESGNSFEHVSTSGSADTQTGSDSTIKYTIVDVTTNAPTDGLKIREMHLPRETDQMVLVHVKAEATNLRGLNCKKPADSFSLHIGADAKKIQQFSGFDAEFEKTLDSKCLALNESQTLDVWFKLPADADLKGAELSLYLGSSAEPLKAKLLKD